MNSPAVKVHAHLESFDIYDSYTPNTRFPDLVMPLDEARVSPARTHYLTWGIF